MTPTRLNTLEQMIAGLTLINTKSEDGKFVTAEHDEIYSGDSGDFSDEEVAQMEEWGWNLHDEFGSFLFFV